MMVSGSDITQSSIFFLARDLIKQHTEMPISLTMLYTKCYSSGTLYLANIFFNLHLIF